MAPSRRRQPRDIPSFDADRGPSGVEGGGNSSSSEADEAGGEFSGPASESFGSSSPARASHHPPSLRPSSPAQPPQRGWAMRAAARAAPKNRHGAGVDRSAIARWRPLAQERVPWGRPAVRPGPARQPSPEPPSAQRGCRRIAANSSAERTRSSGFLAMQAAMTRSTSAA